MVSKVKKTGEVAKEQEGVSKEELGKVEGLVRELLTLMGVKGEVAVGWDEKNSAVQVQIDSEESGLLIGRHGATIEAVQVVLATMVVKCLGRWVRVLCNVGDYRKQREETLVQVALNTAKKAKFSGEPQRLVGLTPGERRIVHLTLVGDGEVETFSEGEEESRCLVVRPKTG